MLGLTHQEPERCTGTLRFQQKLGEISVRNPSATHIDRIAPIKPPWDFSFPGWQLQTLRTEAFLMYLNNGPKQRTVKRPLCHKIPTPSFGTRHAPMAASKEDARNAMGQRHRSSDGEKHTRRPYKRHSEIYLKSTTPERLAHAEGFDERAKSELIPTRVAQNLLNHRFIHKAAWTT